MRRSGRAGGGLCCVQSCVNVVKRLCRPSAADRHAVCVCVLDMFAVDGGAELQGAAYVQEAVKWDSDSDPDESSEDKHLQP